MSFRSRATITIAGVLVAAGVSLLLLLREQGPLGDTPQENAESAFPVPMESAGRLTDVTTKNNPSSMGTPLRTDFIASHWSGVAFPAFAEFRGWTERYLAAPESQRDELLAEGVALARTRRDALSALIQADPRSALAAAVPMVVRQRLPTQVTSHLEERIGGLGTLSLIAGPPMSDDQLGETVFRSALIGRREFRAFVYGRRALGATVTSTYLMGIAVDRNLAVDESPLRVLEAGEIAADRPFDTVSDVSVQPTAIPANAPLNLTSRSAVEYGGKIQILSEASQVGVLTGRLMAADRSPAEIVAVEGPGSSGVIGRPSKEWTHGLKKILIIRVDFSDLSGVPLSWQYGPITEDLVTQVFSGSPEDQNGVDDYFARNSYGKTTIQVRPSVGGDSPDVTPVVRMPQPAAAYAVTGDLGLLQADARAAARSVGVDVESYDRIGVVFSTMVDIPNSQIRGSYAELLGPSFWCNGGFQPSVIAHEIGHTYGLQHANLWKVADGNAVSPSGSSMTYGDPFDIMGHGSSMDSELSHWNRCIAQWIPDTSVTSVTETGIYRIYRFDHSDANLASPLALKLERDDTRNYWIGYRRGTPNASLNNGAYVLWGYRFNQRSDLLDMNTPGTDPYSSAGPGSPAHDQGLTIGATFSDPSAGITLKAVAQGGTGPGEWLDVQVGVQSRIRWERLEYLCDERTGTATLTLVRSGDKLGAVNVVYATAPDSALPDLDYLHQQGTLTWGNGESGAKTITIPLVVNPTTETVKTFKVILNSVSHGVIAGNTTTRVSVVDLSLRDASFLTDHFLTTTRIIPSPDGGVFVGPAVVKIKPDGKIDSEFIDRAEIPVPEVHDLAWQPDGRVIVTGNFPRFLGAPCNRLTRLLPNGQIDPSFRIGSGPDGAVLASLVQPDGRILICGEFRIFDGSTREYLARLNRDGTLDTRFKGPTFMGGVRWKAACLALQPDGKILVGGEFHLDRAGIIQSGIIRLQPTGGLDPEFNGVTYGFDSTVNRIVLQPDGRILAGGTFTTYNRVACGSVARLTPSGGLDVAFGPTLRGSVQAILLQPDGKILVGGTFYSVNGSWSGNLTRLFASGVRDVAFDEGGGYPGHVYDLALLPTGRVLLGGNPSEFQGSPIQSRFWRLLTDLPGSPGTIQFAHSTIAGGEGSSVELTVTRVGGSLGAMIVGFATVPNAATEADFVPVSGTLFWAAGDTSTKTIVVPLSGDGVTEPTESFSVNLGQPLIGGAFLGPRQQATVEIVDNAAPVFTAHPVNRSTILGGAVTLSAFAVGAPAPTLQWRKDGANISGATGNSYVIGSANSSDAGVYTVVATNPHGFVISGAATLSVGPPPFVPAFTTSPASRWIGVGQSTTLRVETSGIPAPALQWYRNNLPLEGKTGATLSIAAITPTDAGVYSATATNSMGSVSTVPIILGVSTTEKVIGAAMEFAADIFVPGNGNTFDQLLLTGSAATITADSGQISRTSFIDVSGDIVQVEFSGAGTLTLGLAVPSGPMPPANYNQTINYMKGHIGLVVAGADRTTHLSIFSVGRITSGNASLFKDDVNYDGSADVAFVAIQSATGEFGGLRAANASFFAASGLVGIYAPGVHFRGPVYLGDINAYLSASPVLVLGLAGDVRIAGGSLYQTNSKSIQVSGISQLKFVDGTDSHGRLVPAKPNRARLVQDGVDVTAQIVVNP